MTSDAGRGAILARSAVQPRKRRAAKPASPPAATFSGTRDRVAAEHTGSGKTRVTLDLDSADYQALIDLANSRSAATHTRQSLASVMRDLIRQAST